MINFIKKLNRKCKGKRLDDIQAKAVEILRTGQGDADKQQRLMNLAQEIEIPIDSSDVYCRRLSYPELFDRIINWIKDRRTEKYTKIGVYTTCISALTAMVAVFVSILIHWQTRQLLAPTERPIISAVDSKCAGNINNDTGMLEIILNLVVKNIGKHPAENIKVIVRGATLENPNDLKNYNEFTLVDQFFPDTQATLSNKINIQLKKLKDQQKKVFLYVRMDYKDAFMAERK